MIVTVTMNPAVDQTLVLQKFVAGDTLRVKSSRFDPGVKGRGIAPRVRAVSAVGSGDAFVAGVVLTLSRGDPMEDALRMGIAAGTAAVLTPGTELCHRREVDILYPRVRVEPVAVAVSSSK